MAFHSFRRPKPLIRLLCVLIIVSVIVLYLKHKRFTAELAAIDDNLQKRAPVAQESRGQPSPASDDLTWRLLTTMDANIIDIEGVYDKKLVDLSELKKCDICLGLEFCHTLVTNLLVTTSPAVSKHVSLRIAVTKTTNEKLTLMSRPPDKWTQLETIICRNGSQPPPPACDQPLAARNSFMAKSDLIVIDNYRHMFRQIIGGGYTYGRPPDDYFLQALFSQCATEKYLQLLRTSFDANDDKRLDLSEQSHLLSALLAFPGYAVHRLIDKTEADLQVLKIRGVCGRLVAFDGNYQTLDAFIKDQKGFEVMAGIGVQIIQLVDDLQDSDADWYYLATDLTADSFAVNSEGEVFLSDLNRVLVIDKSVFTGADKRTARSRQSLLDSRVCNEPCFQTFHNRFKQAFNTTSSLPSLECQRVDVYYGQRMYAMICRNIFSAVESSAGAADDVNGSQTTARPIGLLSSVPNKDKENVDDLLRECMYETSPGGRKQAVEELRDLLNSYLHFDESVDQNSNNNNNNRNNDDNNLNEDDEDNNNDINDTNDDNPERAVH